MEKSDYKNLAQQAEQRSNIYGFLSVAYTEEPSPDFLENVRDESLVKALQELGVVLDEITEADDQEKLLEKLAVEYTRLYVGPGHHIPPFESVYVDAQEVDGKKVLGMMGGKAAKAVSQELEKYGYKVTQNFRNMSDHIATELALMRFLALEENEAWKKKDKKKALMLLASQQNFLSEHLVRWAPEFCDRAKDYAKLKFYQTIASLTKEFVLSEDKNLPELIKMEEEI